MRKNQRYSQEEMYLAIEMWKESRLSQNKYCQQNNLSLNTFKYWLKKYNKEKDKAEPTAKEAFIPMQVSSSVVIPDPQQETGDITITYTNGTTVKCCISIDIQQLKALINL